MVCFNILIRDLLWTNLMTTGFALFFDKASDMTPTVFIQFLSKFVATPQAMVFLNLRPLSKPSVAPADRYTVTSTSIPNCYRLVIRHGYTDEVITHDLALLVYEQIEAYIIRQGALPQRITAVVQSDGHEKGAAVGSASTVPTDTSSDSKGSVDVAEAAGNDTANRLAALTAAYKAQVLYIVGKEQMRIREATRIPRRVALGAFLWLRDNTRSKIAAMNIPTDQLVEVGFIKEV